MEILHSKFDRSDAEKVCEPGLFCYSVVFQKFSNIKFIGFWLSNLKPLLLRLLSIILLLFLFKIYCLLFYNIH